MTEAVAQTHDSIITRGLWRENTALVQLLGLCPLLAVTTTAVNALLLGMATLFVLIASNLVISILRRAFVDTVRIPLFVLIISSFVTAIDLLINAFFHELHTIIGIFIPLIITNCAILAQAETVASRQPPVTALLSGFWTGCGFLVVLVVLGALREIIGQGSLFSGFEMLIGARGAALQIQFPFDGALAALLAPGAFIGLAILLALKNHVDATNESKT